MIPIRLSEKFAAFDHHWHPHRIAQVNDMQVLLVKIAGEFVWHAHESEDELFQVIRGTLYMQFRDHTETVREGEIIVVPKGVEHCPRTENGEEVLLLLFERNGISHTGAVISPLTQRQYPEI